MLHRSIWETRPTLLILTSPLQLLPVWYVLVIFKKISSKSTTWKFGSLCTRHKASNCPWLFIYVWCKQINSLMSMFCPKYLFDDENYIFVKMNYLRWPFGKVYRVLSCTLLWGWLQPFTTGFCNSSICHKDQGPLVFQVFFHRWKKQKAGGPWHS